MSNVISDLASLSPQGFVANIAGKLIDTVASFFPNPEKKAEAAQAIAMAQLQGAFKEQEDQFQLMQAQIEVNKVEAASPSKWVAGWRPGIGWVGVVSLALVYWPKAIVLTIVWTMQSYAIIHGSADIAHIVIPPFPDMGVTDLLGLLGSILGIGSMRTYEKATGSEANR